MRLFLKIVVYCVMFAFANQANLKRLSSNTGKQVFSNFINGQNFNNTRKIFLSQKTIQEPIKWSYYNILFDEMGDKTFISITLLFYQTKTAYLILTSILAKTIFIYVKIIIKEYSLFQFIPAEIFQVIGILIYNIIGFEILFKLMFGNNKEPQDNLKNKKNEDLEKTFYFYFEDFFKVFGVVFFSQISSFSTMQTLIRFNDVNVNILNASQIILCWNYLAINFASILLGALISVLIGFICFKKFSLEFNLIISAITFLLMGIDDAVKFFSVYNEWQI